MLPLWMPEDPGTYIRSAMDTLKSKGTAQRPIQTKQARFTEDGAPVVLGVGSLASNGNPVKALERLQAVDGFYLQVNFAHQRRNENGRSEFTLKGVCDPLIAVRDLGNLLEARFANGAQVQLSETGRRLVQEILRELKAVEEVAAEKTKEAQTRIEECAQMARDLEAQKKALDDDPRVKDAERRVAQLNNEIATRRKRMDEETRRHQMRLLQEELPHDFDPNRFPEAQEIAEAAVERWKETLDDPEHLVGGDFTELETILTSAMQRLVVKVSDRYAKLVDV